MRLGGNGDRDRIAGKERDHDHRPETWEYRMAENIAGKILVLAGASSRLGAETARDLVRESAKFVPGAVATEPPDQISEPDVARGMQDFYEKHAIPADSFARCVLFTATAGSRGHQRDPVPPDQSEALYPVESLAASGLGEYR